MDKRGGFANLSRRRFLARCGKFLLAAASLPPASLWASAVLGDQSFPFTLSDAEWRKRLTKAEYRVLRRGETEDRDSSELLHEKHEGVYICAGCGQQLFSSKTKYDSGTGWPSFWAPIREDAVALRDSSWVVLVRTEVLCSRCGGHLGHVFDDGPEPTGLRYSINGLALDFVAHAGDVL